MRRTYVTCSICGRVEEYHAALRKGWLVASHKEKPGRMVIRCPEHITGHALRIARAKEATP